MAEITVPSPVAVIGLGCIGGSLARALVAQEVEVRGWSDSASDRAQAAAAHVRIAGNEIEGGAAACAGAGIVVLAVPIEKLREVVPTVLGALARNAQLVHVGGLQQREALGLDQTMYERILGTHPLAGSHDSGFAASRPEMFVDAVVSVESRAGARARQCLEWLWYTVGVRRVDYRSAAAHDRLMAWVSQLPQLASTAVAATLSAGGVDAREVGTGARDTTRLAASDLGSWPALFRGSPSDLYEALATLEGTIANLRHALENGDTATVNAIWNVARDWRREGPGRTTERPGGRAAAGSSPERHA